MREKKEKLSKA